MLGKASFVEEKDLVVSTKVKHIGVDWVIVDVIDMCFIFAVEIADNAFSPAVNQKSIISSERAYFVAKGKDSGDRLRKVAIVRRALAFLIEEISLYYFCMMIASQIFKAIK